MTKIVIDVSAYQGTIDWKKVKESGVDAVIIKVIRKDLAPDKKFEENWKGATEAGLKIIGVYIYSYATTVAKAKTDALRVLAILGGRKVKIWLDEEDKTLQGRGKGQIDVINAFGDVIRAKGYEFGIYTGLSFYNANIRPWAGYLKYNFWIARYPSTKTMLISQEPNATKQPLVAHVLEGWQYSSAGSVPGINGKVDLSVWFGEIPDYKPAGNVYPIPERVLYIPKKLLPKMRGDDVKWVQYHLVRLGFMDEYYTNKKGKKVCNIDGIYGKNTEAAVIAAQKHYGIKQDGIVGAETQYVLRWN